MKWIILSLLFFNQALATENAVNEIICSLTPHTVKVMRSMHFTSYRNYILENIANAEEQESIAMSDITRQAESSYTDEAKTSIDQYTPYALQNLVIHAAIERNVQAFEETLQITNNICDDFFRKQQAICVYKSDRYEISKKEKGYLCSAKGITSVMTEVCGNMDLIASQKSRFLSLTTGFFHHLAKQGYFEEQNRIERRELSPTSGMAFASGIVMLMGASTGKTIQELDHANDKIEDKINSGDIDDLIESCKQGELTQTKS
jgi:hypothetical protein